MGLFEGIVNDMTMFFACPQDRSKLVCILNRHFVDCVFRSLKAVQSIQEMANTIEVLPTEWCLQLTTHDII